MKSNTEVTAAVVRKLLRYDAATGALVWRESTGAAAGGSVAGTKHYRGYIYVSLFGKRYGAHRLIWLHQHGKWPDADIDHINGDKADNRIANLRDVSRSVNMQNLKAAKTRNKSTGLLGATRQTGESRFTASIFVGGRSKYLGRFDTAEAAHAAYIAAKRLLHEGCTL